MELKCYIVEPSSFNSFEVHGIQHVCAGHVEFMQIQNNETLKMSKLENENNRT